MRVKESKTRGARPSWVLLALSLCRCGADKSDAPSDGPTYCAEVRDIVEAKCVRCHDEPPKNGAPFSLRSYEDFDQPFPGIPEMKISEAARDAVASSLMPLTSLSLEPEVEPLEPSEKETLLRWFDEGYPRGECE